MNINNIAEYAIVRDTCGKVNINNSKILTSRNKKKKIAAVTKVINVVKWLLRPESENEQPQFDSRLASIWANTVKSLFWMGVAIGMGFLIAQLSA